jgi:excisionase family DNA binding protein
MSAAVGPRSEKTLLHVRVRSAVRQWLRPVERSLGKDAKVARHGVLRVHELARLLDIHEVAELLHVNERHVRRLVFERRIPYIKWGGLLRFDPQEIAIWIDEARNDGEREGPWSRAFVMNDGSAVCLSGSPEVHCACFMRHAIGGRD